MGASLFHAFFFSRVRHGTAQDFDEVERLAFDTTYAYEDAETNKAEALSCSWLGYDTGYRTSEVYDRYLARPGEIILTKGWETLPEKWKPSLVEYYPSGRKNPHAVKLWHVNTGFFKEKLHGLYKRPGDGPGTLHLNRQTTQALDQAIAEHYVYRRPKKGRGKGKWTWETRSEGKANHYGDTIVGAFAVADMKNVRGLATREVLAAERSQLEQQRHKPNPAAASARRTGGRSSRPNGGEGRCARGARFPPAVMPPVCITSRPAPPAPVAKSR